MKLISLSIIAPLFLCMQIQADDWTQLEKTYDYINGLSRQIARTPAELALPKLPAGCGCQVE